MRNPVYCVVGVRSPWSCLAFYFLAKEILQDLFRIKIGMGQSNPRNLCETMDGIAKRITQIEKLQD